MKTRMKIELTLAIVLWSLMVLLQLGASFNPDSTNWREAATVSGALLWVVAFVGMRWMHKSNPFPFWLTMLVAMITLTAIAGVYKASVTPFAIGMNAVAATVILIVVILSYTSPTGETQVED